MSWLEEEKKKYDETPIPPELSERVLDAVKLSEDKRNCEGTKARNRKRYWTAGRWAAAAAAAVVVVFTVGVNTSPAFAQMAVQLPVIGSVARLLTFQSYEKDEGDYKISVEIPSVEMISQDTGLPEEALNQEIHDRCRQYADDAVERAKEYRKAFFDTGGTEEEWEAHNIEIRVGYELKSQTADYLSFVVTGSESWISAYSEMRYYTIDLRKNTLVTLEDILGSDYRQKADDSIRVQMKAREENEGIPFLTPGEGGFSGITENTQFYMNESGNPVVVFEKYEIAPGAYGRLEFEIGR